MIQVALYARVSTNRQHQAQTIDQQLTRLLDYVATQPQWQLDPAHIYRDDGYTGAKLNRPGLDRLRDHARAAHFTHILVTAPDRLARKYVHQVLLIDEFTQLGCTVAFVDRPMSDDPHDQLLLQIRGAVAEYERTLIAERMRRGRQARIRGGQLLPWTRAPYGYILDAEHPRDAQRVHVDPVAAAVVQQIFAAFADPTTKPTLYRVAKQLSDAGIPTPTGKERWNVSTIRGILRSPAYMGLAVCGRTRPVAARQRKSALQPVGTGISKCPTSPDAWITIAVPALVSREQFDAAQMRLDQNRQQARRNNTAHDYLLRGLVSCAACRCRATGRVAQPGYAYYVCAGHTDSLQRAVQDRCRARYIPADRLDALVWEDLCHLLREPALLTQALLRAQGGAWLPQALQAQRTTLQQAIDQLKRQQGRLLEVYLAAIIERAEFERKRQELTQTQQGLQTQLHQVEAQGQQRFDLMDLASGLTAFCERIAPTLAKLDFIQRRALVELLIDRVVVADGEVEIRYVVPTGPAGETVPFCQLRLDYFDVHSAHIVIPNPFRRFAIGHHRTEFGRTRFGGASPGNRNVAAPIAPLGQTHIGEIPRLSRLNS